MAEAGVTGYELSFWTAIFAPAGTPHEILARLNRELTDILTSSEMKQALAQQGVDAESSTPDGLAALLRKEIAKFREVVEQAGITPQ
jgi:tripartite-type tricarboxylate transporter receptor subunit TctC